MGGGEWRNYGHDLSNTRTQSDKESFSPTDLVSSEWRGPTPVVSTTSHRSSLMVASTSPTRPVMSRPTTPTPVNRCGKRRWTPGPRVRWRSHRHPRGRRRHACSSSSTARLAVPAGARRHDGRPACRLAAGARHPDDGDEQLEPGGVRRDGLRRVLGIGRARSTRAGRLRDLDRDGRREGEAIRRRRRNFAAGYAGPASGRPRRRPRYRLCVCRDLQPALAPARGPAGERTAQDRRFSFPPHVRPDRRPLQGPARHLHPRPVGAAGV